MITYQFTNSLTGEIIYGNCLDNQSAILYAQEMADKAGQPFYVRRIQELNWDSFGAEMPIIPSNCH